MTDILDISSSVDFGTEDEVENSVEKLKGNVTRRKGRGFGVVTPRAITKKCDDISDEIDDSDDKNRPQKSVEGWIVFVTSVHEESSEEDIYERFSEFGNIKNIALNLDRRTGFLKGYALIEYEKYEEAYSAIEALDNTEFLGQIMNVNWCFIKKNKRKY